MKQRLQPGGEIDLLTADEVRDLIEQAIEPLRLHPARVRAEADAPTDAAGALTLEVYKVPPGMTFVLTRLLVRADGFTFAVPFNGAGAMLQVLRNDVVIDGKSLVAAAVTPDGLSGLPALFTYGTDAGSFFSNGDAVAVRLTAGPLSTNVSARIEGRLSPLGLGQ